MQTKGCKLFSLGNSTTNYIKCGRVDFTSQPLAPAFKSFVSAHNYQMSMSSEREHAPTNVTSCYLFSFSTPSALPYDICQDEALTSAPSSTQNTSLDPLVFAVKNVPNKTFPRSRLYSANARKVFPFIPLSGSTSTI